MKKKLKYVALAFTPGSGSKLKGIVEMVITSLKGLKQTVDEILENSEEKAPVIC